MKKLLALVLLLCVACTSLGASAEEGNIKMHLDGIMGERYQANLTMWLQCAPYANPGMVQMYGRRNQSHQALVPWYGEFSGKYLTSAALAYAMEPDGALKRAGDYVVSQLASYQGSDGYLGVWPDTEKLAGHTASGDKTWDAWSHYHNLLGLYLWHQATGSEQAEQVMLRGADCLYDFFVAKGHVIDEDKDGTDAAIGHIFALLYQTYGDKRYLEAVQACMNAFTGIHGGNYYEAGLEDIPFYRMKRTRWECLHAIEAIKEMAVITGEESYRTSFVNIWEGIVRNDRHNTGGFSSGEAACGNPYDTRAIETCCTIAWMALTEDMLNLTGESMAADELELSTWNALLGAQQADGRSFTYNTPMLGEKKASAHDIVFQAVAGSGELNCCSVNGPRGFGMIGEWGLKVDSLGVTVNYYGASESSLTLTDGSAMTLTQTGTYPMGDTIRLEAAMASGTETTLRLRIPFWSEQTEVQVNGQARTGVHGGEYFEIPGIVDGDRIDIRFDMSLHFWQGNYELGGKTSLYYGPILLALDQRFEPDALNDFPALDLSTLSVEKADCPDTLWPAPALMLRVTDGQGTTALLCDFASAGQTGTSYTTWLSTDAALTPLSSVQTAQSWGQRISND